YSFSSAYGGCFYTTGTLRVLTWLPLCLLLLELAGEATRKKKIVPIASFLAVFISFMWTAGFPQAALYASFYLALYALLMPASARGRAVGVLIGAGAAGMLLAAPQLVATFELAGVSTRTGQGPDFALWGSLFPPAYAAILFPSLNPVFSVSFYIGILPVFLVAAVLTSGKHRREKVFLGLALLFGLLAMGKYNFFYAFLVEKFSLTALRNPSKFLFFCTASLALLAGFGWDRCFKEKGEREVSPHRQRAWVFLFGAAVFFPLAASLVFTWGHPFWAAAGRQIAQNAFSGKADPLKEVQFYYDKADLLLKLLGEAFSYRHPRNIATFVFAGFSLGALVFAVRNSRTRFLKEAILSLVILDLYLFGTSALGPGAGAGFIGNAGPMPVADGSLIRRVQELQAENGGVLAEYVSGVNPLEPSSNMFSGIRHAGAYSPLLIQRYYELIKDLGLADCSLGKRTLSEETWTKQRKILDAAGITLILSDRKLGLPNLELTDRVSRYFIYKNIAALPELYAVYSWKEIPGKKERLDYLKSGIFDPAREAVVEEALPAGPETPSGFLPIPARRTDRTIDGEVRLDHDAVVVFINTFYPRWKVRVDGVPGKVIPVNHALCGVFVPEGEHKIQFYYDDTLHRMMGKISLGGWVALLLLNLFLLEKRKPWHAF
ncbi:MAG: hypothetical protein HYT89_03875, partial [Candidatus Omnitrophica bacterium]|nr:hypothetical protein [Candidatus Omnitrophota bacterium]